jgi:hypothetical protein
MTSENIIQSWSPEQNKVIEMYQQKLGMTRSNAIRKLRQQEQRGITAAQILEAPVKPELRRVQEKPATKAPKEKSEPKAKKSIEPKEPAFSTKPAGKGDAYAIEGHRGKYDKQLVVNLFMDGGKTPSEIAALGSPGIKGISPVYCHRILFGNEESGGIYKGQAARRKEQAARVKAWAAEKVADKKASK